IDQYLEFIGVLGPDELDPTSEFIEMAARLVYMKSVSLLPRREESEELERELTGQLIEYHLCKNAAERLRDMSEGINFYVREPLEIEFDNDYRFEHSPNELLAAYMNIMGKSARFKPATTESFDQLVTAPIVSVSSKIIYILRNLKRGTFSKLNDFFRDSRSRSEAVATFLGVLELIRFQRITVEDDGTVCKTERKKKERINS
ncbi:MAG: segregation/condensation protein A, partial [Oscillospiraceae bacterium]